MKRMTVIASLYLTTTSWAQGAGGAETNANGKRQRDGSAGA
jgi:hypothetical protein